MVVLLGTTLRAGAAQYAAMVMDARTGKVIYSRNADTRLPPASLTKMMTLYVAFEAVKRGEIGLDTKVTISKNAANEVPSKIGLRAGQQIEFRYLIRAAAVKSANDAATAIGEAVAGSEAKFARRMNRTAKRIGMTRSTFKNAHGLTESGHLSTASDMTTLGRRLFFDYPEYYNLFSRRTTDAKITTVRNTNRKFLNAYPGADGIKTGYTNAAGSCLVASAQRGNQRIITTVFGASSSAARNAKVAELMDIGFRKAPKYAEVSIPALPAPDAADDSEQTAASATRLALAVGRSLRPLGRPLTGAATETRTAALQTGIDAAVALASTAGPINATVASALDATATPEQMAIATPPPSLPAGTDPTLASTAPDAARVTDATPPPAAPGGTQLAVFEASPAPKARPRKLDYAASAPDPAETIAKQVVVARASTSGSRHWGINVGRYNSQYSAERVLLKTALMEMGTLDGALRKVSQKSTGFDANFVGLSEDQAALACKRLTASGAECSTFGPNGS
jgi:D-alanyl-D-alanine carboxypeptidase